MTQPALAPQPQQLAQLTPAQMAALLALVQSQAALRRQLTQTAVAAVLLPFRALSAADWWDADKVSGAIRQALAIIQPAQRNAVAIADAYIARATSIMTGRTVRPAGSIEVTRIRRVIPAPILEQLAEMPGRLPVDEPGVTAPGRRRAARPGRSPAWIELGDTWNGPADTVDDEFWAMVDESLKEFLPPSYAYGRVADNFRYQVTVRGDTEDKAQQKALVRLAAVAETDVTLAVREQYRHSMGQVTATGWRRVLHPELSETGPCGLCIVAANRVYKVADLMPLHNACRCEVLPIIGNLDPGFTLNSNDLSNLYKAAGGTARDALKRVRVVLAEHGELGPILVNGDQKYRDPIAVAKSQSADPRIRARSELDALLEINDITKFRVERGESLPKSLRWQQDRIAELQALLS
ncbi:hypothetical protein [Actinoplanes sp. URMC 104]|uniref:hypothetical protein n=1 Tax=Actinoplanes sp. URMC 104 TaxID=3423409 RepID=UPI003F1C7BFE